MIQQALRNELRIAGLARAVVSVVTQVLVDADDPAFAMPVKPIGPFLPEDLAQARMRDTGETWSRIDARGWRKLVPSPQPLGSVEVDAIHALLDAGAGIELLPSNAQAARFAALAVAPHLASSLLPRA
jgi:carbamate kinase